MKKLIFSSLIAVLVLSLLPNETMAQTDDNPEKIYSFVSLENPPSYIGGMNAFYTYLGANIKYPKLAYENKIQGNVFISFVVEKNGSITDVKVERKLGYGTDEEAARVVKSSPNWNPGLIDGKAVRVKYNIPVKFSLAKGK